MATLRLFFHSFCLFVLIQSSVKGAISPKFERKNLTKIKKEISNQKKDLKKIREKIGDLEHSLGKKNNKFLLVINKRKDLEIIIYKAKKNVLEESLSIKKEIAYTQKLLRSVIVNTMNDQRIEDLVLKSVYKNRLVKQLEKLNYLYKKNVGNKNELASLDEKLNEYIETENELNLVIAELEKNKINKTNIYYSKKNKTEELQGHFDQLKVKVSKSKRIMKNKNIKFYSPPIKNHIKLDYKNGKGVTFSFNKKQPVFATGSGKVVYQGTLSTYGNVVMIKHPENTRSVIFGEFKPKVKKGITINKADIIGYTSGNQDRGKLYFEIRKKNIVQNTINLIDENLLANNASNLRN